MQSLSRLWVVVPAGGEGRRLAASTRDSAGRPVPKQFFEFERNGSLLKHALDRAARLTKPERIIAVVQEAHRRWWEVELSDLNDRNIVVQTTNRGTAVALLHALHRALERDRDPYLLVMPSDHEVQNELAWHRTLHRAVSRAGEWPDQLILVGMEPQADPDFGWLLLGDRAPDGTYPVGAFVEKPGAREAAKLVRRGALCSTFAFASSGAALLALFNRHAPDLVAQYAQSRARSDASPAGREDDFAALPFCDFSRDLLERAPGDVRVVSADPCGWTDLGTPFRLERWLRRRGGPNAATRSTHETEPVALAG